MADIRGRPFAYVALTLSVWVGARIVMSMDNHMALAPLPLAKGAASLVAQQTTGTARIAAFPNRVKKFDAMPLSPPRLRRYPVLTNSGLTPAYDPWQDGGRPPGFSLAALVADKDEPQSAGRDTPPSTTLARMGEAGPPEQRSLPAIRGGALSRWGGEVYAYSFWRQSTGDGSVLAPGAQYGGSQSGIIGTFDPFNSPDRGLSLLARGSITPDGDNREVALGIRWRPGSNWPLTVSAERRFRAGAPDRFAAYLAGGVDSLPIAGRLSLDAFGQAGYVTGRGSGGFFDAQARAMYPLTKISGVPLSAGAGVWAGGQKDALRVDVGPTLIGNIDTGPTTILIQLDWRLHAAGNAEPQNGLALTISTGF